MKVGIISDSHDHLENLEAALEHLVAEGVHAIIHCGDLCAPFVVQTLNETEIPTHIVFGNVDDKHLTTRVADEAEHVTLHGDTAELELGSKTFFVTHFPLPAKLAARSGSYDVVCHGHTHTYNQENIDGTLLLNPGEIMGRKEEPRLAIYDTDSGVVSSEIIELM